MKYLIFILLLAACNSSSKKKTTYKVEDWVVSVPANLKTWDEISGWGKMVIYTDSTQYKDDTASSGDITHHKSLVSDTFYFIRVDSTGLPNFHISWSKNISALKDVIKPLLPIPSRYLPLLYSSMVKDSTIKDTTAKAKGKTDSILKTTKPLKGH
jgi:hypothetical protein